MVSDEYYSYKNNKWEELIFNGSFFSLESIPELTDGLYYVNGTSYYIYDSSWKDCTYGIYQLRYYEGETK